MHNIHENSVAATPSWASGDLLGVLGTESRPGRFLIRTVTKLANGGHRFQLSEISESGAVMRTEFQGRQDEKNPRIVLIGRNGTRLFRFRTAAQQVARENKYAGPSPTPPAQISHFVRL